MQSVFNYRDYKSLLKNLCAENRSTRGFQTQLAAAAGCQHSYLSQVLHSHVHLTPDHACNLAQHLGLDELETDYFFGLVDLGRAGNPKLKQHLQKKLDQIRRKAHDLANRVKQPSIAGVEAQARFYSSWHFGAIHVIVTIPEYQTPTAISRKLNLPVETVLEALRELKTLGLVKNEGEIWTLTAGDIHIPKESPLNSVNHQNWRARAVLDSQNPQNDSTHYSAIFSVGADDFARIRELLLKFIDEKRAIVAPSPCEQIACLTCDLFKL